MKTGGSHAESEKTVTESYKKSAAAVSKGRGTKTVTQNWPKMRPFWNSDSALALVLGYDGVIGAGISGSARVKLGLANLVTMVGLYCMGTKGTALIRRGACTLIGHPVRAALQPSCLASQNSLSLTPSLALYQAIQAIQGWWESSILGGSGP